MILVSPGSNMQHRFKYLPINYLSWLACGCVMYMADHGRSQFT